MSLGVAEFSKAHNGECGACVNCKCGRFMFDEIFNNEVTCCFMKTESLCCSGDLFFQLGSSHTFLYLIIPITYLKVSMFTAFVNFGLLFSLGANLCGVLDPLKCLYVIYFLPSL